MKKINQFCFVFLSILSLILKGMDPNLESIESNTFLEVELEKRIEAQLTYYRITSNNIQLMNRTINEQQYDRLYKFTNSSADRIWHDEIYPNYGIDPAEFAGEDKKFFETIQHIRNQLSELYKKSYN